MRFHISEQWSEKLFLKGESDSAFISFIQIVYSPLKVLQLSLYQMKSLLFLWYE